MLIEQELASVLMPLVNNRAYPIVLPQGVSYPAITFHRKDGKWATGQVNSLLKLLDTTGFQSVFQVAIWSPKYSDVSMLMPDVINSVETIDSLELDSVADNYEDQKGKKIYCKVIEFTAWDTLQETTCQTQFAEIQNNMIVDVSNAVVSTLQSRLGSTVQLIDLYENQQMNTVVDLPAVLIDTDPVDIGQARGDDTFPLQVQFTAYCLVANGQDQRTTCQWLTGQVANTVLFNHWGMDNTVDHPEITGIERYTWRPGCNGFECWQLQWNQVIYMSEPEPVTPSPDTIYASKSPEIGKDYQPDYEQLTGFEET